MKDNQPVSGDAVKFATAVDSQPGSDIRQLSVPQGCFRLERKPKNDALQAWDAADEYLLNYIDDEKLVSPSVRVLIVNDAFGALSVALSDHGPTMVSDSFLAKTALEQNLAVNRLQANSVNFDNGLQARNEKSDLILIKVPKSLALLERQLYLLRASLTTGTRIIAAGMSRAVHKSTLELFENILGPTTTSLARKKARLIFCSAVSPVPTGHIDDRVHYTVETDRDFEIYSHANVFSRDRLDAGSRLLIENMPSADHYQCIADLGCGNGVLGIIAASVNTESKLFFADESYLAIASARQNFSAAFGAEREANFSVTNSLQGVDDDSLDLVLNNPPFHQQHAVGDAIAWQMFIDARRVLKPQGELWVVGNRHLGYHAKLKKIFGLCEIVDSNRKFVVLKAVKKAAKTARG